MKRPKLKIVQWPKRTLPEPDMHKLEGEMYVDGPDVFGGHHDYRPDCITRSDGFGPECVNYAFEYDSNSYFDVHAYGLPGDFSEDSGW